MSLIDFMRDDPEQQAEKHLFEAVLRMVNNPRWDPLRSVEFAERIAVEMDSTEFPVYQGEDHINDMRALVSLMADLVHNTGSKRKFSKYFREIGEQCGGVNLAAHRLKIRPHLFAQAIGRVMEQPAALNARKLHRMKGAAR